MLSIASTPKIFKMHCGCGVDFAREQSYPTQFQNSSLFPLLLMSLAMEKHTPDTTEYFNREYDFIVVGAGTAGAVVAARLSEDPSKTVLLLEAGKAPPLVSQIPSTLNAFYGSDLDWNFTTVPQERAALGHVNHSVKLGVGKTVGGTTPMTAKLYVRGSPLNYNSWEKVGAYGWGYHDVLPYFLKAENNTDPEVAFNGFHSVHGAMTVGRFPYTSEFEQPLISAAKYLGYPYIDINGAGKSGIDFIQANVRKGENLSPAKAYLVPNDYRPNLTIVAEAYVTKVLITPKNKRAVGVQFYFKKSRYQVRAKSEVILSAGALKTPQILMLSGIGPSKTLQRFDIPVIADLPVGEGYQDQPGTFFNFFTDEDRPTFPEKLRNPENIWKYIKSRKGILASTAGCFGMAHLTDEKTPNPTNEPAYAMYFFEGEWGPVPPFGLTQKVYDQLYGPYLNKSTFFCAVQLLDTKSRGYVTIQSKNPYDHPVINPRYYTSPEDILHVVEGIKTCIRLVGSPPMKKFDYRPFKTLIPGCEGLSDTDEYLKCYTRSYVFPYGRHSGTARMGDPNDRKTVLDPYLRVKGVKGLRVVDASIMPSLPYATYSAVVMIAEKASDMIKKHL